MPNTNWSIVIRGSGPMHNNKADDADRIARRVVQELRAAGHTVDDANFNYGERADVGDNSSDEAKVSPAAQPM